MGFFSSLFSSKGSKSDLKVRRSDDKTVGDRYTHTGKKEHVHESYTNDHGKNRYTEYRGGEKSNDRHYNKKK